MPQIQLHMSSLNGEKKAMSAKEVCETWKRGFEGLDAINHLSGIHIVIKHGATADVFAYATATHYNKVATQGNTREFVEVIICTS